MNIVFGKGDRFAHIQFQNRHGFLGKPIAYTEPNNSRFFSKKYGYCVPIDQTGVPLEYLLDDYSGSDLGEKYTPLPQVIRYFRITEDGQLLRLVLNEGSTRAFHQRPIFNEGYGWWLLEGELEMSNDTKILFGYLMTNPTEDAVTEFCMTLSGGVPLEWFSITEITEHLKSLK